MGAKTPAGAGESEAAKRPSRTGRSQRADLALVERGFFESRAQARAAIEAGGVVADGATVSKPSQSIAAEAVIEATPAHPWASRGGVKLAHGLDVFGVDVSGRTCLDVGASTGGFTDVLLARGAARVIAVDVGRGQLHPRLKCDPRVVSLEATDARALTRGQVPAGTDLVVCDASFIGLAKVLARPLELAAPRAELVALFKPQFEVGARFVGKNGIVADNPAVEGALSSVIAWLEAENWRLKSVADSPIRGGDGNLERLVHAMRAPLSP